VNRANSTEATELSVIVPVSRMAGRLRELETWLRQSEGLPIEVMIIHDMQDEGTGKDLRILIDRYKSLNIVFLEGHFGSPGAARNEALALDLKKWVCFWDSDDLPHVENVLRAIREADPTDEILIGNYSIINTDKLTNHFHHNNLDIVALNPGLWRMVFRSEIIGTLRFAPYRMGEDQLFLVKLNFGSRKVKFSKDIFYSYFRGHPNQLTALVPARKEVSLVLIEICKAIDKNLILRNRFSDTVKGRLFLTLIKNQDHHRLNLAKIFRLSNQFDIELSNLFGVIKILLSEKLLRNVFISNKFGPR
jgi:hypothetical protein